MADRYQRWNDWAPRYITDLIHDFGFTDFQAAAFPGNFAAESGHFNSLQELNPLVKGSKGGLGHAQWTGPRRRAFEAWVKRKGLKVDSYEANYSYLFRELSGLQPGFDYRSVARQVKAAKTLADAVYVVGKYYEGPAVLNLGPRTKGAEEALALYRKAPAVARIQPEHKETAMADTTKPSAAAIPWYKSVVTVGSGSGLGASLVAILAVYKPGVPLTSQLDTLSPPVIAAIATLSSLISRLSSAAQPVTLTQDHADDIVEARAQDPVVNPVPVAIPDMPLTQLPLQQLVQELPLVVDALSALFPVVGALQRGLSDSQKLLPTPGAK